MGVQVPSATPLQMKFKRYQKRSPYSYTLGVSPTIELLKTFPGLVLEVVLSSNSLESSGGRKIQELFPSAKVEDKLISLFSPREDIHALGFFEKFAQEVDSDKNQVVLFHPEGTGNLGTICRTMAAMGVSQLAIIEPGADFFHPSTIRASMGAVFHIKHGYFCDFSSWDKSFSGDIFIFSPDGLRDVRDTKFSTPFALLFGNEGSGIPSGILSRGTSLRIPFLSEKVDSLSLPVSVSIALFQAVFSSPRRI